MSNFIMCTKCQAVISTGTLGIFGPSAIIDEFHARIGGVIVEQYAVVSCNKTFPSMCFQKKNFFKFISKENKAFFLVKNYIFSNKPFTIYFFDHFYQGPR